MHRILTRSLVCAVVALLWAMMPYCCPAAVPVIYSTDLYHPHDDPDDHYDLATLFALPELDVRGIIIDMSNIGEIRSHQSGGKQPGLVAVQQLVHLTGKKVPVVTGLDKPMSSPGDQALEQPAEAQAAVELILTTLEQAQEKVCIFTVGSLRDVAVAYNRQPDLLRAKVRAIYVNAGTGPSGYQREWNVLLDPAAYQRILLSDLPVHWYPCFGEDNYRTYFRVDQTEVVGGCAAPLKAYFDYALTRSQEDPLAYLSRSCTAPSGPRNMWCTPSFVDLAGRKIYRTDNGYEALPAPPTAGAEPVVCYQMQPVKLSLVNQPAAIPATSGMTGRYVDAQQDLVGKKSLEPDGIRDCHVAIRGLPREKAIEKAELKGPRQGTWFSYADPTRWLLKTQWQNDELALYFTYWAAGEHELTLSYADGSRQSVKFDVPPPHAPCFAANLKVDKSNVVVIRNQEPAYTEVMSSCLKNILAAFPATSATK